MEKDSALYQLMDTRMHSVMNGIVSSDGEYQAILRKSDIYSGELDRMDLSKEIRLLIDRYVSEQNALGSRFGMLAYLLGFSDCKAMFLGKYLPTEAKEMNTELLDFDHCGCILNHARSSSGVTVSFVKYSFRAVLVVSENKNLYHILFHVRIKHRLSIQCEEYKYFHLQNYCVHCQSTP